MKRILRRVGALLLVITMVIGVIPIGTLAATYELVPMCVCTGYEEELPQESDFFFVYVINKEGDVFISGEDISRLSGYSLQTNIKAKQIDFVRGIKTVRIDFKEKTLQYIVPSYSTEIHIDEGIISVEDSYYLSASAVLPWLNVNLAIDSGVLYCSCDMISLWDYIEDFNNIRGNLDCFYLDIMDKCGYTTGATIVAALQDFSLGDVFKDVITVPIELFSGYLFSDYEDYMSEFQNMVAEETALSTLLQDYGKTVKNGKAAINLLDMYQWSEGIVDHSGDGIEKAFGTSGKIAKTTANYVAYIYTVCNCDFSCKLDALATVFTDYGDAGYSKVAHDAAQTVHGRYSDIGNGLFDMLVYDLFDFASGKILDGGLKEYATDKVIKLFENAISTDTTLFGSWRKDTLKAPIVCRGQLFES